MSTEPFGFIGLGAMGGPMIEKAFEAGLTVHVFEHQSSIPGQRSP
jgi:3-hydroxyisobutyrate dehydrogenase-like beta-hydroxyacid dehydrogenase